ncbi:MAG TPA: hypothetical protein VGF15_05680 [Solirubrobacteraceae bacterium]|jgi:hypothetical protein
MNFWIALVTLLLLAAVIFVISSPLRALHSAGSDSVERSELEAARDAKYREIRDCELDWRTGKLSDEDYRAIDGALRSEALSILERLGELDGELAGGAGEE